MRGVAYGTFDSRLRGIGGVRMRFPRGFASTVIWDGEEVHPTVELRLPRAQVVSLLWIALEDLGASYSIAF